MTQLSTGVRLGIMRPDPRPMLADGRCPGCGNRVRMTVTPPIPPALDESIDAELVCGKCGAEFDLRLKELDS